jgi:hypothetical protein
MKKLLFLLPVLLLAASMLHAADTIGTVNSFNGDIILVHSGHASWVSVGALLYADDQICVRASGAGSNDWIKVDDIVTPGICQIKQAQVIGFPDGRIWDAKEQCFVADPNEGNGGTNLIVIPKPDHYFLLPHEASRD